MSPKTLNISYWVATIIFALWLIGDGIGGVMQAQAGIDSLTHLGYPVYLLTLSGIAKLLAAIAILQTRFYTIKEWAFAGYAFTCFLAAGSHYFAGDSVLRMLAPFAFLALAAIPYYLWKRISAQPVQL